MSREKNNYINGKELKEELHKFSRSYKKHTKDIFNEMRSNISIVDIEVASEDYITNQKIIKFKEFLKENNLKLTKNNKYTLQERFEEEVGKYTDWEHMQEYYKKKGFFQDLYFKKASKEAHGVISEELGEMFLMLASNLASKKNWINYTYKEEMVGRGVLYLCKYAHNFNKWHPRANAFAYVTQICKNGFIQAKETEDKQSIAKDGLIKQSMEFTELDRWLESGVCYE